MALNNNINKKLKSCLSDNKFNSSYGNNISYIRNINDVVYNNGLRNDSDDSNNDADDVDNGGDNGGDIHDTDIDIYKRVEIQVQSLCDVIVYVAYSSSG